MIDPRKDTERMRLFALSAPKLPLATAMALLSLAAISAHAQPDPPAEAGRLSYISGTVSIQPAGVNDWGQAFPNLPLGPGDRVFTDADGRAEIQVGQTFLRLGPNSDVSVIDSTPTGLYFGVARGSVHLRIRGLWDGQAVYVNTPSGSATEATPGELRIDVIPDQDAALFTPFDDGNVVEVTGAGGFAQQIGQGEALELAGSNPVVPQWLGVSEIDELDRWSRTRDQQTGSAASYQYVSREIPGANELDAAGSWTPGTPYGAVWFPNNVAGDWAPYHQGHWINRSPWGWVWVEDESWGYAPFHYGRWVSYNGRWGWVPGPPAEHPVWSPALVVFAGGQPGVSAWFPLGPGEPYRPWYPCSPRYVDRVNISNITVTNVVHVQTTYVNFNFGAVVFANRAHVVAVNNADFASGRPVAQVHVTVNVNLTEHVQVIAAPEPKPTAQSFVGHAPARPVPVAAARPVLINEKGKAVAAAPGAKPVEAPVKAAPVIKPLPGHTAVAPPAGAANRPQPGGRAPQQLEKPENKAVPENKATPENKPMPEAKPQPAAPVKPVPAEKPVAPPAEKPVVKPAPEPAVKPVPETTARPAAPTTTKPAEPMAPAKPGTTPPAKTDKDKKKDKDKDKDEKKPE
jgi:hypothetical protein